MNHGGEPRENLTGFFRVFNGDKGRVTETDMTTDEFGLLGGGRVLDTRRHNVVTAIKVAIHKSRPRDMNKNDFFF
jgi:hypothetical protein